MVKYKVFLKNGTVFEIEADGFLLKNAGVLFVTVNPSSHIGLFPFDALDGFYRSDIVVKLPNDSVNSPNPAGK